MNTQTHIQNSFIERISDGTVTINSIKEFETIINIFPHNPILYRAFADLLAQKKLSDNAASTYNTAASLYFNQGMILQGIAAKILELRFSKPSQNEFDTLYTLLQEQTFENTPFQDFILKMNYVELTAFINTLELMLISADTTVKQYGDEKKGIFFVVSGRLKEFITLVEGKNILEKKTNALRENEFFGDTYPFEDTKKYRSTIKTLTRVELINITHDNLLNLCREYPHIEQLLHQLYKNRLLAGERALEHSKNKRTTARHLLPTKIDIKIFQKDAGKPPLVLSAFTNDISVGGTGIILDEIYKTGPYKELIGRNVKIQMSLPTLNKKIHILGTIVWSKESLHEVDKVIAIGIQFKDMSYTDQRLLKVYCGSEGEQNLIWNLWESLLKK